jgi:hypothetical protein
MKIKDLQDRLREHIRSRIGNREFNGSELARQAGLPQGHLSNFLNSHRGLSLESMDRLLDALAIGVMDLVTTDEIQHWIAQPAPRSRYDVVPRISGSIAMMPRLPRNGVLEVHCIDKSLLRRLRSDDVAGRQLWQRFVFVGLGGADVRGIVPTAGKGATVLVDRYYTSLQPYHSSRPNLYLVRLGERLAIGRALLLSGHLIVQPCDQRCEVSSIALTPGTHHFDYVVGRVCQLRAEP